VETYESPDITWEDNRVYVLRIGYSSWWPMDYELEDQLNFEEKMNMSLDISQQIVYTYIEHDNGQHIIQTNSEGVLTDSEGTNTEEEL